MIRLYKLKITLTSGETHIVPDAYTACNGEYFVEKQYCSWQMYRTDPRTGKSGFVRSFATLKDVRAYLNTKIGG